MKVLLINNGHSQGGGAFTVYHNTAKVLMDSGVEVIYFALHSPKELACEQAKYFADEITQNKRISYVTKRFYNRNAARCLQRLIDDEQPDIAQAHLIWGGLAPSILHVLKRNHIPVIHVVHDYAMICSLVTLRGIDGNVCELCSKGHFYNSIKSRCHRGSAFRSMLATAEIYHRNFWHHPVDLIDHFMFVSHFCADKHAEMDNRFINVSKSILYNVPDEIVSRISKEDLPYTFESYYLYYGRLSYEKGLGTLISTFSKHPELSLKIVGSGPMEEKLKEECKSRKASNIEFLGYKTGEDLYRLVQHSKFVCVPSEWYENNPMTVIEAYTLGVPVIAANIGGIPEIVIENSTGFLFKSGSTYELDDVIKKTRELEEPEYIKMKYNARNFSYDNFDRKTYSQQILNMFNDVINKYR